MVHHCHWHHVYVCAIGAAELNLAGQCKPAVVQKVNCMRAATSGPPRRGRRWVKVGGRAACVRVAAN